MRFICAYFYCLKKLEANGVVEELNNGFTKYTEDKNFERYAVKYLAVKGAYDRADQKWYRPYPQDDVSMNSIKKQTEFDYQYTKCKMGDANACESLEGSKKSYTTYDFSDLKVIDIPKVDGKNQTFTTADGEIYSAKTGKIIGYANVNSQEKVKQRLNELKVQTSEKKPAVEKISQKEKASDKDDSDFKCEWADVFPRKILHGPGCKTGGSKICTGYVSCSWKNRKVNRLATCSERYCADSTATECANQPGYGSKSAEGVNDQYQSDSQNTESSKVKSNQ